MLLCRFSWLNLLILLIHILAVKSNSTLNRFNISLKTPGTDEPATEFAHKSIHVIYNLPDQVGQWNIVGFEPQIQLHQNTIGQLTVHVCNLRLFQPIWYDKEVVCDNTQSMLIYQWTPSTSLAPFYLCDDCSFEFNKFQTIILTVTYKLEKRAHKEQSGVTLYISTTPTRFRMGTMFIGHPEQGTHFSCRSSTYPRLFYAVKKLRYEKDYFSYQIHNIRIRQFGRKLIQNIFDSDKLSGHNQTNTEYFSADLFYISGDYLFLQCENVKQRNCHFLLYYSYKTTLKGNADQCDLNSFPDLFKFIPPKIVANTEQTLTSKKTLNVEGSTVFFILCMLLVFIWLSIIIGCIIMRRIRGLVNFRTESSPFSAQKNKSFLNARRIPTGDINQRIADTDNVMQQLDMEHGTMH